LNLFLRDSAEAPPPSKKGISLRVSPRLLAYIDAMSEHADISRNAMGEQLLEWGVRYALGELPDEIRDEIVESVDGPEAVSAYHQN
jgi:hypothetical protein